MCFGEFLALINAHQNDGSTPGTWWFGAVFVWISLVMIRPAKTHHVHAKEKLAQAFTEAAKRGEAPSAFKGQLNFSHDKLL